MFQTRQLVWSLPLLLTGCAWMGPLSPLAPIERAMIYQPAPFPDSPGRNSQPFEDAWFHAKDGTKLHGWYREHPQPRGVALFCHGNVGNIASRAESLLILNRRHKLSVMMFDYRGYGKSKGSPSEQGILQDARAARAWLAKRTRVAESDIIIMGRSLGGAVAVDLAANDSARGLVLASTFPSLPEVAAHHVPWALPSLNMTQRLNSVKKIPRYHGRLLQSHGDADELIPIQMGRKLFKAASGPKRFVVIRNGGHNDPQSIEYRQALDEFIDTLPDVLRWQRPNPNIKASFGAPLIIGKWKTISSERDGKPWDGPQLTQITFAADGKMSYEGEGSKDTAEFMLDESRSPKAIKLNNIRGIYAVDGDTLRLCYRVSVVPFVTSGQLPRSFRTKKGDGLMLLTLKRSSD